MAEIEKYKSVKRFGPRYGRRLKERFGKIESIQRSKQKCPYCSALSVKRIAVGIWNCRKCNTKFTGKAYSVKKKLTTKEEAPEEITEEPSSSENLSNSEESDKTKEEVA